jgi:hypothetical protein
VSSAAAGQHRCAQLTQHLPPLGQRSIGTRRPPGRQLLGNGLPQRH